MFGIKQNSDCDDALQNFNICFNKLVIRKVVEVLIINHMSKRRCSLMEEKMNKMNIEKYKSGPFSYVMSSILHSKMPTKTKPVWESGVGLEASSLKRNLM